MPSVEREDAHELLDGGLFCGAKRIDSTQGWRGLHPSARPQSEPTKFVLFHHCPSAECHYPCNQFFHRASARSVSVETPHWSRYRSSPSEWIKPAHRRFHRLRWSLRHSPVDLMRLPGRRGRSTIRQLSNSIRVGRKQY